MEAPPFVPWEHFFPAFAGAWKIGQHITMVGGTDSGKTSVARNLITLRGSVVVMATKARDTSLYGPLLAEGFIQVERFDPEPQPEEHLRYILKPQMLSAGKSARQEQADVIGDALDDVFLQGNWCVYSDEVRYLSKNLGLGTELETLWLQGRSLGISMVAATQRPVSIPLEAFSQATHLFLWSEGDKVNIDRMAEFTGQAYDQVRWTIPRLPPHEFLYWNKKTGQTVRSKLPVRLVV